MKYACILAALSAAAIATPYPDAAPDVADATQGFASSVSTLPGPGGLRGIQPTKRNDEPSVAEATQDYAHTLPGSDGERGAFIHTKRNEAPGTFITSVTPVEAAVPLPTSTSGVHPLDTAVEKRHIAGFASSLTSIPGPGRLRGIKPTGVGLDKRGDGEATGVANPPLESATIITFPPGQTS